MLYIVYFAPHMYSLCNKLFRYIVYSLYVTLFLYAFFSTHVCILYEYNFIASQKICSKNACVHRSSYYHHRRFSFSPSYTFLSLSRDLIIHEGITGLNVISPRDIWQSFYIPPSFDIDCVKRCVKSNVSYGSTPYVYSCGRVS